MTLYLTSTGFENEYVAQRFKNVIIKKDIKQISFLVISVQDNDSDAFYLQKTKNELDKIGAINIDVFELRDEPFVPVKEYDVIYVCGGNTFVYMDRIRKTGLDKFIIDSVKSDRSIYVGVSAGSIIAGPDITIAGGEDSNDLGLVNLQGLCLTNFVIFPHYHDDLKTEVDDFRAKYGYQVYEITDEQAIRLSYSDMGALKGVISMEFVNKD
ncbi:MAG: Type 1 glutamine amidotransferase-like domain-containing protein [Candidatus Falkowbacteria bacterium]